MYSFTVSTDSVGLFGNPWHMHLALQRLWGESHAAKIGLEVVATHRALHVLNTHPHLYQHLSGFHSKTHLRTHPLYSLNWLTNQLLHHPKDLTRTKIHTHLPYILLHEPAYNQFSPNQLHALNYPLMVVENDGTLGSVHKTASTSLRLGPKNLIIDWLHYFSETPYLYDWQKLISVLEHYASITHGWHISVGTRDNLPPIPPEVLAHTGKLARSHHIQIIIEHQFTPPRLLHNRPHLDMPTLKHLDHQYRYLHTHGLIRL